MSFPASCTCTLVHSQCSGYAPKRTVTPIGQSRISAMGFIHTWIKWYSPPPLYPCLDPNRKCPAFERIFIHFQMHRSTACGFKWTMQQLVRMSTVSALSEGEMEPHVPKQGSISPFFCPFLFSKPRWGKFIMQGYERTCAQRTLQ